MSGRHVVKNYAYKNKKPNEIRVKKGTREIHQNKMFRRKKKKKNKHEDHETGYPKKFIFK